MDELRHSADAQQPTPSELLERCYQDAATDLLQEVNERYSATEFQIFDCIQMLEHFLHLFHERRAEFLQKYTNFAMEDNAVSQTLKEKLLELIGRAYSRQVANYDDRGTGA